MGGKHKGKKQKPHAQRGDSASSLFAAEGAVADLARLLETDPADDPLNNGLAQLVRTGMFGHVVALGVGPLVSTVVREAPKSPATCAITAATHDPRESVAFVSRDRDAVQHWPFMLSVAPAVVRGGRDAGWVVLDPGEIVPASLDPPDLVVVIGLPRGLGGRAGSLRAAAAMAREGTIVLIPSVDEPELPDVAEWLRDLGDAAEAATVRGGDRLHLLVEMRRPVG